MCIGLSIWEKDVKIFLTYAITQQNMMSAEEYFNDQIYSMTCPVMAGNYFIQLPHHCPMNKIVMVAEMRLGMGSATSTHQKWPGFNHGWIPNMPALEIHTESSVWRHSPGGLTCNLVAGGLYWKASIMECSLSLLSQTLILGMDLPFLHTILLPKPLSVSLQNALFTIMVFYKVFLLTKEHISQLK